MTKFYRLYRRRYNAFCNWSGRGFQLWDTPPQTYAGMEVRLLNAGLNGEGFVHCRTVQTDRYCREVVR